MFVGLKRSSIRREFLLPTLRRSMQKDVGEFIDAFSIERRNEWDFLMVDALLMRVR